MTPQERDLIQGVFDRLAQAGQMGRDPEAEALIRAQLARQPEAPYSLVQAVIMLEMSLNQAHQQMAELQRQLAAGRAPAPAGGSFLGGAAGPWGSVPNSGPQPQPQAYAAPVSPQGFAPQAPSAVGGFLRNAATMAAGVAGGTLLAEGLSSLFGGHRGGFGGGVGGSPWGGGQPEMVENVTNNYYDGQSGGDAGFDTASYDDGGGYDDGASSYDDGSDLV